MTKAELIRKIAKRSGVPDSEAKIFFEIFLKRISVLLKPGEAVKLNALGYFQLRKAQVQSMLTTTAEKISSDLIVFSPVKEEAEEAAENLIFNIPSYILENESYNLLDSYFSISVGKPVIPLTGVKETEFFIPPAGNELRKLIESKVDKLLRSAQLITEHVKGSEFLVIKPDLSEKDQFELPWENKPQASEEKKKKTAVENEGEKTSEFSHIAWDFGEDLSRQIEEESLLDVESEPEKISASGRKDEFNNISWDFGIPEENEIISGGEAGAEENESPAGEPIKDYTKNEDESENKQAENVIADNFTTREFEERVAEDLKKYQRVRAITQEISDDEVQKAGDKKENVDWDFGKQQTEFEKVEDYISNYDETREIDLTGTGDYRDVLLEEKDISELYETNEEISGTENKEKINAGGDAGPSIISEKEHKKGKEKANDYTSKTKTREYSYSNKRSPVVFFIALVTILSVGTALYIYLSHVNIGMFISGNKAHEKVLSASSPEIIDRTFDVPVTYPYTNDSVKKDLKQEGIDPQALVSKGQAQEKQSGELKSNLSSLLNEKSRPGKAASNKEEPKSENILPPSNKIEKTESAAGPAGKVEGNIYKSGGYYIVQVSSWKSKSIAEREADRFKSGGYNSFIEQASIAGRGIWYRVKVGNFKTLAEAENFSKRIK